MFFVVGLAVQLLDRKRWRQSTRAASCIRNHRTLWGFMDVVNAQVSMVRRIIYSKKVVLECKELHYTVEFGGKKGSDTVEIKFTSVRSADNDSNEKLDEGNK